MRRGYTRGRSRNAIGATWIFEEVPGSCSRRIPPYFSVASTCRNFLRTFAFAAVERRQTLPLTATGTGRDGSRGPAKSRNSFIRNKRAGDLPDCQANQTNRRFLGRDWLPWQSGTFWFRKISDTCQSLDAVYSRALILKRLASYIFSHLQMFPKVLVLQYQ